MDFDEWVHASLNGLTVSSSANGRDESDNLVLKFTATMEVAEEFFYV